MLKNLKKEILQHKTIYLFLTPIIIGALFFRIYGIENTLGFYFDQGRDAIVIWDFLYKGKIFLIGPTTGIAGIFRGPFYYYLITPFYFLGNGNPLYPSIFLSITSVLAIVLLFYLASVFQDRVTGIIAATVAGFSFYIVLASRWLSNPTPMLLISMLLVFAMYLVTKGKNWAWILISFLLGTSLFHFGSSGEFFYFPAVFIFLLWQRKNFPSKKNFLSSVLVFLLSASPLILFDLRHDGLLFSNIKKFFVDDQSFKASFWEVARTRLDFYYDVFSSKLFDVRREREIVLMLIVSGAFFAFLPKFLKNDGAKIVILLLISPLIGLLFFQGNYGNIYDYYLTGYYFIFILLFALVLGRMWKFLLGKAFVLFFFWVFFSYNFNLTLWRISDKLTGPHSIGFGNQKQALDWIYEDANGERFSVDVYVPPVIPYAYDYLFRWYGGRVRGYEPEVSPIDPLYTLYEQDPPHPERLSAWLDRQEGIGKVETEARFGGITVQRRKRIEK